MQLTRWKAVAGFNSPNLRDEIVAREVACEWVKENRERWTGWMPSICPPGSESDDSITKCLKCTAGFWCAGGTESARECQGGEYCPANSSAPVSCPDGFTSARRSQGPSDCNLCVPYYLPVQNRCVRATLVLPAVVLPLLAATGALVLAYAYYTKVEANKKYKLSAEEIDFGENPRGLGFELAGSMSAGRAAQSVWQATYKGAPVAAKVILTQQEENGTLFLRESSRERKVRSQFLKDFEKEMRMVCSLRHDHVATPIGFVAQAHKVVIVMEVMRYGSLYDLLHNETLEIDESMVVEILLDVALGMKFLHSQPIAHKYLSSNNVLLGRNLSAKVADFAYPRRGKNVVKNLRKALEDEKVLGSGGRKGGREAADESWATSAVVYMAPEILTGGESSCAGDVYAFGMLTFEVMAQKDPFSDQQCSLVEILKEIVKCELDVPKRLPIPAQVNPSLVSLCRECAHMQNEMRPHFGEVERRLKSLMTGLHDASASADAAGRPFKSVKSDKQNLEDNTYSRDQFLVCRHSYQLGKGITRNSTRKANNSFKGLASIASSTADAASLTIKQLLLEVFPSHVAKALMEGRKVEPESKECVTIFFSDIVGYTDLGGSMEPHLVMNMLDRLYTKFDLLSEKYDVFKVETIGDAYMAVANLHKDQSAGRSLGFLYTGNEREISAILNLEFRQILELNLLILRQTADHVHP
jgi:serine/threonine protein kinase